MKIESLKDFIKLVRYKNFSKLAKDLSISQSTLSHRILQIEQELGDIVLINRTTKKFELTEEGKIFLDYAKKIVELFDSCAQELSRHAKHQIENIIITASTLPGSHILPKYIANFRAKHPNVNFKVIINNSKKSIDLLLKNRADFAGIGSFMDSKQNDFEYIKIGEDELIFICSNNHELLHGGKSEAYFDHLVKFPFILREEGSGTRNVLEEQFSDFDQLSIELEINDNDSIISAVSESNYISVLSKQIAKKAEDAHLVKILNVKEYPVIAKRDIYFLKLKEDKKLSKLKKEFWEYLKH